MNEFSKGQLTELCQMVYRGCKPCAMMPIMAKNIQVAKMVCTMENCKFKAVELSDGWFTFWIYIRDELPKVIDLLPLEPKTEADHYLIGALFGYSNDAICDYLNAFEKSKAGGKIFNYGQVPTNVH
jgi:hypothetical protein